MRLSVEVEREEDGRWLGEVPELPGVLAYGETRAEAVTRAQAFALQVIADRMERGEPLPQTADVPLTGGFGGAFDWLAEEPDLYDDTCGEIISE